MGDIMNIETRLLYAIAFTLLGIVLAVYVLPVKALPDMGPMVEAMQ